MNEKEFVKAIDEIRELCKSHDMVLVDSDYDCMNISVKYPYSELETYIDLEGNTVDEMILSFKESANYELEQMINHLNDCKFSEE